MFLTGVGYPAKKAGDRLLPAFTYFPILVASIIRKLCMESLTVDECKKKISPYDLNSFLAFGEAHNRMLLLSPCMHCVPHTNTRLFQVEILSRSVLNLVELYLGKTALSWGRIGLM